MSVEISRPEITLLVNGKSITFLCDTGACRTTCREIIPGSRPGPHTVTVRTADGNFTKANESEPVWLRDPKGCSGQLAILMLPECPVNLLGRDGLLLLGLALVPTLAGYIAVKRRSELEKGEIFVLEEKGTPLMYYSLDVPNRAPHQTGTALMHEGRQAILTPQDAMPPDDLHITMWYKNTPGPDKDYDKRLKQLTPTRVTVNYLYSDAKHNSVAGVTLSPDIFKLFKMWTPPHISLYKGKDLEWKDLGKIVQNGEWATDWVATSVNTWASSNTGLTRKSLFWTIQVDEGTHLQPTQM